MINILFVCHGNICRSPMAEYILKDKVRILGLDKLFQISSAATTSEEIWGQVGNPVYPPAKKILAEHGISCSEKRAVLMTKNDYKTHDLIIGMDSENLHDMLRICGGDPDNKISLLMDYTDTPGDVADPWFTRDFQKTYDDIEKGISGLIDHLRKKGLLNQQENY